MDDLHWLSYKGRLFLFLGEDLLFEFAAPAIAAGIAVATHNAMTGDDQGHGIVRACLGNGTSFFGIAERLSNLAVRTRFAVGDGSQFGPHAPLEGGSLHVER